MNIRVSLLPALFFLIFHGAGAQTLRGVLRDADRGTPVAGAGLELRSAANPSPYAAQSDADGAYLLENIRPGTYQFQVKAAGYAPLLLQQIPIAAGKETVLEIALRPLAAELPDVLILAAAPGRRPLQSISEIPLTREQNLRFPATFFDPARLALAYPGVANADDQANGLSIRGNGPGAVRWRLEGVDIVNPNHLTNAGTFNDRPASASGGVLMFSAQLLDNASLLTGSFPAGYGDALGGIMDIYLRKGNPERHEFTAQAGLIGFDLAAEGPIQKGKSSYLANYRYSTVGLLGQMGISFGGESIRFQDFSFKLDFTGNKGGQWSVFGMGGVNTTTFEPPADSADVEAYKDLFNIRFDSRTAIAGVRHWTTLGPKTWIRWSLAGSVQENERLAEGAGLLEQDDQTESRLGLNVTVSHRINSAHLLLGGLNSQTSHFDLLALRNGQAPLYGGGARFEQYQPWVQWAWSGPAEKTVLRLGIHTHLFNARTDQVLSGDQNLEPRLTLQHRLRRDHQLTLSAGMFSQSQPAWVYTSRLQTGGGLFGPYWNQSLGLTRAFHGGLRHSWSAGRQWVLKSELFYQRLYDVPVHANRRDAFSLLNLSEIQELQDTLLGTGAGENKGLELSAERYFQGDWFLIANLTLLDARTRGSDEQWRKARWNFGQLLNLTAGKEWTRERSAGRVRSFGVNGRATWHGGYRVMPVDAAASEQAQTTVFFSSAGFSEQLPGFFRLDGRVYWRRSIGNRRNSTLAMEFQNLTLQENIAYYYYDPYTKNVETKYQLGLIPNLSWRLEF